MGSERNRCAVFLDRDGTLIEDRGHLSSPDEVRFFSATIGALERLRDDFLFFLVTNQPGVAEGSSPWSKWSGSTPMWSPCWPRRG